MGFIATSLPALPLSVVLSLGPAMMLALAQELPPEVAIPPSRPHVAEPEVRESPKPSVAVTPPVERAVVPTPIPASEAICRAQLREIGAEFQEQAAVADPAGCGIPHPVVLTRLTKTIGLEPGALLNCPMAIASARFARDVMGPAARAELGQELASIGQASAYVCRPRTGGGKLSEHAFGNALDMGSFMLSDGQAIVVGATRTLEQAAFQNAIRTAACGPFKTVLGPGSDAAHALHFHFDLAPRKNGATFCQ